MGSRSKKENARVHEGGDARDKLKGRAGMRAAGFERKLKEDKGSGLARKCWEEVNKRSIAGRNLSQWQEKKRECFRGMGMELDGRE